MRLFKVLGVAMACLLLAGCGGHGYEGTWTSDFGGSMTIGPDYIESRGVRTKYDKIFVRKGALGEYLVFDTAGKEEAMRIKNKDTLAQDVGLAVMILRRAK